MAPEPAQADPGPPTVAVLGLGSMGSSFVGRLLDCEVPVSTWNRSPARGGGLDHRTRRAATPAEAVADADVVILALSDDEAVTSVVLGADGALAAVRPGCVIVDTSTVHPRTARHLHQECTAAGVHFLDAPLSGGPAKAADGTLTLFCGGDDEAFARARPVLQMVASRVEHLGGPGAGQVVKAINQVVLAGAYLGVAEGVAMAEAAGLDARSVLAALRDGAASSWVLRERAELMATRSFPPLGRMSLHLKDLGIALGLARESGQVLPGATLVAGMEGVLVGEGRGDQDVSALILYLRADESSR